ncbi:NAD(P)H dehydrogenase [Caulobacter sp. Root1455]|uniref:NAD(P)H-dependent oxidoreductase n=1 Tax=Caulobacter sp. Root1455 TaxID=1736465 RepID=UPI0006F58B27|nr:NAD(P)H-dependent oxidoreductase [Caulobacter sp. Root1455]KQY92838.1 NAD(P)H dehydrogenase [Caulobacter sp. Root1455]
MKYAVILAHPKPTSFCAAVARTCVAALEQGGAQAVLRDLYALDFDPRLKAEELPVGRGWAPAPDVVAERALLSDVDGFVFVYPFWFNAPPAILKGYVDRVLSMGFGYQPGPHGADPLLVGKTLMSISTSGAPEHWVDATGALTALMSVFDLHLAAVTGLRVAGHEHLGGVTGPMAEEAAQDVLDRVTRVIGATLVPPSQAT